MTDTTKTEALADEYARCAAKASLESIYGTSKSYTAECQRDENEARAELIRAISAVEAERDRLAAECEALRADAERYRWLRDGQCADWAICEWSYEDGAYFADSRPARVVDEAITAAMGGKE